MPDTRWIRLPVALAAIALALAACSASGSGPNPSPDEAATTTSAATSTVTFPLRIESIEILAPDALEVWVGVNGCRGVTVEVEESADEVRLRAFQTLPADADCTDQGLIHVEESRLDAELGARRVLVEGGGETCLFAQPSFVCLPVSMVAGGTERSHGSASPSARPIDVPIEDGVFTLTLSDDTVVQLNPGGAVEQPFVIETRWLTPDVGEVPAEVTVHNLDRPAVDLEPLDLEVGDHPAYLLSTDSEPLGPRTVLAIDTGTWWVDIEASTVDEAVAERTRLGLLEGLTIVDRPGSLPLIDVAGGRLAPASEVVISGGEFGGSGAQFVPAPNCEDDLYGGEGCVPAAGYLERFGPVDGYLAGTGEPVFAERDDLQEWWEAGVGPDAAVEVVALGPAHTPPSCTGPPAFDPALLPTGLPREDAVSAVRTYTGLEAWQVRSSPGSVTEFVGQITTPGVVAVYERLAPGLWTAVQVTACEPVG